jgi:beta-1,4-mannosyl-glycoprotein beta-1,4-N-acetylglucosaminyltransferase
MILDCILFRDEYDILFLRIKELENVVDQFVLLEGTHTFQGAEKPIASDNLPDFLQPYKDRIVSLVYNDNYRGQESRTSWDRERLQRDNLYPYLWSFNESPVALVSSFDEIPRAGKVKEYLNYDGIVGYNLIHNYYYLNMRKANFGTWVGTHMTKRKFMPQSVTDLLNRDPDYIVREGGWHFSYLGGVEGIIKKVETAAHWELNRPDVKDKKHLEECLAHGEDLFFRKGENYELVENPDLPQAVYDYPEIFNKYLRRG